MSEVMEKQEQTTLDAGAVRHEEPPAPKKGRSPAEKKKRRRLIRRIVAVVLVLAVALGCVKWFGGDGGENSEVGTAMVGYGSITSVVEGSGLVKARDSETITLTTAGTVMDVFVTEGEVVEAGTPLFTIDSPNAVTEVQKAREEVEGYQKQINTLQKDIAGLNLSPSYAGKLMDVATLNPGDEISKGTKVATLADDTKMRLEQYYSYAYAGDLKAGQTVQVSLPALMTTVEGTIEAVHMVSRVTPEGSKLFSAEIVIPNAGVLAKDMVATATATVGGETVYPYEAGKLEYNRVGDLLSTVSGTVISSSLVNYLSVTPGQVLVRIDGEDSESEIFTAQQALEEAQKKLEAAQENLDHCSAVAPISGQVIGLSVTPGQELAANTTLVTISDTSAVTVSATVDERNISYIKPGMSVELNQWDNMGFGTVETVSLSSTVSNGTASYPVTITADNSEGTLQVNSYINYSIQASQNDNCLMVPIQAVRTVGLEDGSSATAVYIQADSQPENALVLAYEEEIIPAGFYPVAVEIGIQDTYNVEIKSGLNEGDTVFTQLISNEMWG